MTDKTDKKTDTKTEVEVVAPAYVVTCADEGVQINVGRRLGFVGAGLDLPRFAEVVPVLFKVFGATIAMTSSEENDWVKQQQALRDWQQVNATMQQKLEALADQVGLLYAGYLPFSDPKQLKHGVKGHMVRPHKVHIANKISFTCGGGEQTYNLGNFVVSADWIHAADADLAREVIMAQVAFLQALSSEGKLEYVFEITGQLPEETIQANLKILQKILS